MNVLITGSTSGIGLGIAKAFAGAGYNIAMNGLEADGAEIAENVAQEFGVKTFFSAANLMFPEQINKMMSEAQEWLGEISILVNNAGIQHVCSIDEFPDEMWEKILAVNLSSTFYTTKHVLKSMKKNKFGRIINIASAHGLVASENKGAYVAAKHGVVGFTKVTALEGAPFNITCNAICPGFVKTQLVTKQIEDNAKRLGITEEEAIEKVILAKHAVKEFVTIDEIAKLALFLASADAGLITGTAMPIDGGWTAQ